MTRQDILQAAALIFSQKGYHATSMQDISEAVGLKKASLYHHISSKQEILLDLLDQAMDLLIERITQVVSQPGSPPGLLRLVMRCYLDTLAEHRELAVVLLLEYRSLEPELYQRHIPRRDRFESIWRDLLTEGKESGFFGCSDASLTARALLGVLNSTLFWYRRDGSLTAIEIADRFADLFLQGLLVRTDGNSPSDLPEHKRRDQPGTMRNNVR